MGSASMVRAYFLTFLVICCADAALAKHAPDGSLAWVDAYRDEHGTRWCGTEDGETTTVAYFGEASPGQCEVRVGDTYMVLPCGRVHPSQGGSGVVCWMNRSVVTLRPKNIRCVFYVSSM